MRKEMARFLAETKETKQGLDHSGISSDKEKLMESKGASRLLPANIVEVGNSNRSEVALTFDDGPSEYTPQILAILLHYGVKAMSFSVGLIIAQFPTYLQQDLAGGNGVGTHTFMN